MRNAEWLIGLLLLVWEPLNFAVRGLQVLPTLAYRCWAASLELGAHGLIAAFCAAAGMMLWNGAADARRLAQVAIVVSVARVLQSVYWSALPNDTVPGQEWIQAAAATAIGITLSVILHLGGATRSGRPSR